MRHVFYSIFIFLLSVSMLFSQSKEASPLFSNSSPVDVKLGFSIKEVKKETNDSVYVATEMQYKSDDGTWETIPIDMKIRGNFRKAKCSFPQLTFKIKKKDRKNTLFDGNKTLKLVLPCQTKSNADALVVKEYLCYKLYDQITDYNFMTRLVNLTLFDENNKKEKTYELKAFFIEDDTPVAKRFDAKMRKELRLHPIRIQDTMSVRHDFFQYMVGNTDWSVLAQHNIKVMQLPETKEFIPLPYDFDLTGVVNAPYATVNEDLPINSVRDRLYRGFCRTDELFYHVRDEYLNLEPSFRNVLEEYKEALGEKEYDDVVKYLDRFFDVLKNEGQFKSHILNGCRKA